MKYAVSQITERHIPIVLSLMRDFAEFEDLSNFLDVSALKLSAAMFGPDAFVEGFIAFDRDEPAGYAIFYPCFSTFRGQRGFFLDDLYVAEKYRGTFCGALMLRKLIGLPSTWGFERIDFHVLDWNMPALGFYQKFGAVVANDERYLKFTDEAFASLVGETHSAA